jgi:hypothetical protein
MYPPLGGEKGTLFYLFAHKVMKILCVIFPVGDILAFLRRKNDFFPKCFKSGVA